MRKNRNKSMKFKFDEFKKTQKCAVCGETRPYVLDFHHINPEDKSHSISDMVSTGYSLKAIMKEVEKCEVLCANCHRELHYKEKLVLFV